MSGTRRRESHPSFGRTADGRRPLGQALAIALFLMAVEAVGGWLTGSLALLADAGHLLADVGSLAIAVVASWLAARPATAHMSYGYRRAEILAAATNGIVLWAVAGAILYEAAQRLRAPHPVSALGMLIVAIVGLAGNLASGAVLAPTREANLNVRAALMHILADAAAAVGTIAAGFVILMTGWTRADAVVSFGIAGLVLVASWPLVREAVRILMEGTPPHLSLAEVEQAIRAVPGVAGVHDLHIWSLTSGVEALSGHLLVADPQESQRVLGAVCELLSERYGLGHVTLQVETTEFTAPWHASCAPEATSAER